MNKRILVPLDGSKLAEMVLPHAVAIARASNYGLTLLRVAISPTSVTPTTWGFPPATKLWEGWDQELKDESQYLEEVAASLRTRDLNVQTELLEDEPVEGIISYAEQHPEVGLIAMSTHGRSGLGRLVFGSVAERILHDSPVPLLVVRPRQEEELPADFDIPTYKSLLVPLDGSVFASHALGFATTLATSLDAKMVLVSSVPGPPITGELISSLATPLKWPDETELLREHLQQNLKSLETQGLATEIMLEYGPPAEAILRVAESTHTDLIVMASHGRTGLPRLWLGSIAMKIVQASTLPILLVRAKERVKEPATRHVYARTDTGVALVLET